MARTDIPAGLHACRRDDAFRRKLGAFLQELGDFPPEEVPKATAHLDQWTAWCDDRGIAAVARAEHNDWYLCTLKNAAVRPDLRGRGVGSALYVAVAEKAKRNPSCLVLAADVTVTNIPSIRALKRAGFRPVNRFCWQPGEKPADVMQYVQLPPDGDRC